MTSEPICVAPNRPVIDGGEGVGSQADEAAVYWTDINRFLVHRFVPRDKKVETWLFDESVTARQRMFVSKPVDSSTDGPGFDSTRRVLTRAGLLWIG